jgi:ATP-binding cassette subfamily C (CFTR/MRP) protein 1
MRLPSSRLVSLFAGLGMFKAALDGVVYSPTAFFDSTPMGRIISRLSKDQDTVDNDLSWTTYLVSFPFLDQFVLH